MPCLFAVFALATPRLVIVGLWLFTSWFVGLFGAALWPILGFIVLPIVRPHCGPLQNTRLPNCAAHPWFAESGMHWRRRDFTLRRRRYSGHWCFG